jgi:dienelactone hydrolase
MGLCSVTKGQFKRMQASHSRAVKRVAVLFGAVLLAACASPSQRIDREAARAGLTRSVVQGTGFRHVVFATSGTGSASQELTVFLEGDGIPWIDGRVPADDPTTRDALVLHLMTQSQGNSLYVARPCYQEMRDAACSAELWTFARYAETIVNSMTKVVESHAAKLNAQRVRLVGYSGGGVLAVLIAERLNNVASVVTIAANLDVSAWAAHHGYLPLNDSLDPAKSILPHPWHEVHLQGALDKTVPIASTRAYFERFESATSITFDEYDHVCCWVQDWDKLQEKIREELGVTAKKE